MLDIPTIEPTEFTAGDTVKWTKELSDYPAGTYALNYVMQLLSGGTPITVTATADGSNHSITISAAISADYVAGDYHWYSYATDIATGLERYSVDHGSLTIKPDPTAFTATTDLRSHARTVLAAIEATLEGVASSNQLKVQIDGRTLEKYSIADLLVLRDRYKQDVAREDAAEKVAKGLGTGARILTRM